MSECNKTKMMDANEAVASVAHRMNEVCVIYPITPSSSMGEFADMWSAAGKTNLWGAVPQVQEMQSEAGAAGACHGSVQSGSLTTTFTSSQGLLLMLPNMYKIAGELSPFVMHVAARSLACNGLSIFGDHSDVMAARQTGFAMLCSNSPQEAGDFAAIAQTASMRSKIPFMHFFDGFRTSHEIKNISSLSDDELHKMLKDVDRNIVVNNALSPEKPIIRGTAQNPDIYFQVREAGNIFYDKCEEIVQEEMDKLQHITGREYKVVEYVGPKDAENIIIIMGSGAQAVEDTLEYLNENGYKAGIVKVRLYRPFPKEAFVRAIPHTVKTISVLDRTKEAGSVGEPLYLDVVTTMAQAFSNNKIEKLPKIYGGRYGLSSKDFSPAMVKAIYDNAASLEAINGFTVGINDDVTYKSLSYDDNALDVEGNKVVRAIFFGLGSDGTIGANKNSIKIIAEDAGKCGQGYFVYDSKKAGSMTISHLRFSSTPIKAPYLIDKTDFIACHHFPFIKRIDILKMAKPNSTFLLNAPYEGDEVWDHLPIQVQKQIIDKKLNFYVINAVDVARKTGMGAKINTIMQTCFFAISNVIPQEQAILHIKDSIQKTYGNKSAEIVAANFKAVDESLSHLHRVSVPNAVTSTFNMTPPVPCNSPDFVKNVTGEIIANRGEELPVSAFSEVVDGSWPACTTQYEKRRIATSIPIWDKDTCIQCGKCSLVCPHGVIRFKAIDKEKLENAPKGFKSTPYKGKEFEGKEFILQISPEDCTGCSLCTQACPAKNKLNPERKAINMDLIENNLDRERENWEFFNQLPYINRTQVTKNLPKTTQFIQPLFEFSGACAGCGETPYIKLLTQLFGDRTLIANATGCSSIYGGNLPTTPYCVDDKGRGPAWSNSLFEDNAEFGLGMKFSIDQQQTSAQVLLNKLRNEIGSELVDEILNSPQTTDQEIEAQRDRIQTLKEILNVVNSDEAKHLIAIADYLIKKSVWIVGGDGWAYDIGFGGLDHVIASGKNVNILVMDTGVYSNTGGQQSKATPVGASAKFAVSGKEMPKKDLGLMLMSYGNVYVAQIAFGANDMQTIKAFNEAEAFDGPSIIIAYSHCIAHGYPLAQGLSHQKLAVETGAWPLYRHNPDNVDTGKPALQLDSKAPSLPISEFMDSENRFQIVKKKNPEHYQILVDKAQKQVKEKWKLYEYLAKYNPNNEN